MNNRDLAEQMIDTLFRMVRQRKGSGLESNPEMSVLQTLWMEEKISDKGLQPSVISSKMGIKPATVTPLLNKLEKEGDIVREFSLQDRRVVHVFLTESGRNRCLKANNIQLYWYEAFVEREGVENCRVFLKVMEDLMEFQKNMVLQEHSHSRQSF